MLFEKIIDPADYAKRNSKILQQLSLEAGTIDDTEKLIETLENISYEGVMGINEVDEYHNAKSGPGYLPNLGIQWIDGKEVIIYPEELKTGEIVLPPWMK